MRKGFTLVELVVVVGIASATLAALAGLFVTFYEIYGYQRAYMAAGSSGTAIRSIEAAVLPAENILASRVFSGTTYTSGITELVLELPSIDSSGVVISGAHDYIAIYTSGTELYMKTEIGAGSSRTSGTKKLSSSLYSLAFSYNAGSPAAASQVTMDIITRSSSKGETIENHLTQVMRLRNK